MSQSTKISEKKSTLVASIKAAQSTKSNNGSSTKNPTFYNQQKNHMISNLVGHDNVIVRIAACGDRCCPTKILQGQLNVEQDATVLKTILMHPSLPEKAIATFMTDARVELVDNDKELEAYLVERIKA